jgi:hypothetical protein
VLAPLFDVDGKGTTFELDASRTVWQAVPITTLGARVQLKPVADKTDTWTLEYVDRNAGKPAISELQIPPAALAAQSMIKHKKAIGNLTVKEIRDELRSRGRPVSGRREHVVPRLRRAMAERYVAEQSPKEKPVGPQILAFEFKEYKGNLADLARLASFEALNVDQLRQIIKFHREEKTYAALNLGLAASKPLLEVELRRLINFERLRKEIVPVAVVRRGRPPKESAPPPAATIVEGKRQSRPSAAALELIADDQTMQDVVDEADEFDDICFCGKRGTKKGQGAAIQCSGESCKNGWVHYECVKFTEEDIAYWENEAPESKPYYCPDCEGTTELDSQNPADLHADDDAIDLTEEAVPDNLGP